MVTEPLIHGRGTPAEAWAAWRPPRPVLALEGCSRLVVVAPHPDDEVLGVGGLIMTAASTGAAVQVVAVTDGGASHPGSPTLSRTDLERLRPAESAAALARLGVTAGALRLAVPDGAVADAQERVTDAVAALVTGGAASSAPQGCTWVVTTWRGDGHPDHEATGRACARACEATGARLLEHPVWTWHWATPGDARVPWGRAAALPLSAEVQHAKAEAVGCFTTQVRALSDHPADAPVLGPHVLERLLREEEVVFT